MYGFAVRSAPYQGTRNCAVSALEARGIFSFEKTAPVRRREARLCRAECTPHFLFETPKRKCAVHGGKEKVPGMSWPLTGQLTHTKERPVRTAAKMKAFGRLR